MTLIASTGGASKQLVAEMQHRLSIVDGGSPVRPVVTLEEHLSRTALGPERIATALVGTSAAVSLALAAIGVYGVMADTVVQRRREIAVRLALGARGRHVVGDVLRDGLRIAAAGVAIGLTAAWIAVRALVHTAPGFGVPALWMWIVCPLVLSALVALAGIVPARYALAIDPLTLTREE
jgi:putative ABC transport system permease protein